MARSSDSARPQGAPAISSDTMSSAPDPAANPASGPLRGIDVVEIASTASAAYCGRLLAGLGARVLLLEPPGGGPLRREGPFPADAPHRERAASHLHLNRGKQSAALNLATRSGRRRLHSLLDATDALVIDGEPAQWQRLSLEPGNLQATHPALVVATISPFGNNGPHRDWSGTELTSYAAGGYLRITGSPHREPVKAWGRQAQLQAGIHAALGTLAALSAAGRDGQGQHVDVAVAEAVSFLLGGTLQSAYFFDTEPARNGARLVGFGDGHTYPSTVRPCLDGFVHAHCNNRFPESMALLFDQPRLSEPELLRSMMGNADEIDALMAPKLEAETRASIVREAQDLRIPFTEVLAPSEVLADDAGHHAARGFFVEHPDGADGRALYPGAPIRLGETPWSDQPAPRFNEHAAALQSDAATRARWRRAGVA